MRLLILWFYPSEFGPELPTVDLADRLYRVFDKTDPRNAGYFMGGVNILQRQGRTIFVTGGKVFYQSKIVLGSVIPIHYGHVAGCLVSLIVGAIGAAIATLLARCSERSGRVDVAERPPGTAMPDESRTPHDDRG